MFVSCPSQLYFGLYQEQSMHSTRTIIENRVLLITPSTHLTPLQDRCQMVYELSLQVHTNDRLSLKSNFTFGSPSLSYHPYK